MAVMRLARAVPAAPDHAGLTDALAQPAERMDVVEAGGTEKPLTRAELRYLVAAFLFVVVGAVAGILLDDGKRHYTPPDGVSVFALVYVAAQAIERLLEPLSHFYGATTAGAAPPAAAPATVTKSIAVKARDTALALSNPVDAARESALWQEMIDQIRRNTTTLWALASMLGMVLSGWLGLLLLDALGAPHAPRWLDIVVTGLIVGGGTKGLHDLISNIQASKERKQNPDEAWSA